MSKNQLEQKIGKIKILREEVNKINKNIFLKVWLFYFL